MQQVDQGLQFYAQHDPEMLVRQALTFVGQLLQTSMQMLALGVAALAVGLLTNSFPAIPARDE